MSDNFRKVQNFLNKDVSQELIFLWDIVWPLTLSIFVVALVIFIVLTMGLIQLQLKFHHRMTQDARFDTDLVRVLADQLVRINAIEQKNSIEEHIPNLLEKYNQRDNKTLEYGLNVQKLCNEFAGRIVGGAKNIKGDPANVTYQVSQLCNDQLRTILSISYTGVDMAKITKDDVISTLYDSLVGKNIENDVTLRVDDVKTDAGIGLLVNQVISSFSKLRSAQDNLSKEPDVQTHVEYCENIKFYVQEIKSNKTNVFLAPLTAKWTTSSCETVLNSRESAGLVLNQYIYSSGQSGSMGNTPSPANVDPAGGTRSGKSTDLNGDAALVTDIDIENNDLVDSYRFYKETPMLSRVFDYLINAPIDISFIVIVVGASVLGSTLHLMYNNINPDQVVQKIAERNRYHYVVQYIMVGVVVSLLFYILSRTALISLMDRAVAEDSFSLNPYLVAFIAALAGVLSNETFERIVNVGAKSIEGNQVAKNSGIPKAVVDPKSRKRTTATS